MSAYPDAEERCLDCKHKFKHHFYGACRKPNCDCDEFDGSMKAASKATGVYKDSQQESANWWVKLFVGVLILFTIGAAVNAIWEPRPVDPNPNEPYWPMCLDHLTGLEEEC